MSNFTSEAVFTGFACESSDKARFCRDELPNLLREIRSQTVFVEKTSVTTSDANANNRFYGHYGRLGDPERPN